MFWASSLWENRLSSWSLNPLDRMFISSIVSRLSFQGTCTQMMLTSDDARSSRSIINFVTEGINCPTYLFTCVMSCLISYGSIRGKTSVHERFFLHFLVWFPHLWPQSFNWILHFFPSFVLSIFIFPIHCPISSFLNIL